MHNFELFAQGQPLPFTQPPTTPYQAEPLAEGRGFKLLLEEAELLWLPSLLPAEVNDRALDYLLANPSHPPHSTHWASLSDEEFAAIGFTNIHWLRQSGRFYGKTLQLPRLTAWYGDGQTIYSYSGISSYPQPWNAGLSYLKRAVEKLSGCRFNSVLLNWYRDGEDHMSWHADDEPELGDMPVIASLSFGAPRDFLIRRKDDHTQKITLPLGHGSLLIMRGAMQRHWQHAVPKRRGVKGSRVNLTFRWIQSAVSV